MKTAKTWQLMNHKLDSLPHYYTSPPAHWGQNIFEVGLNIHAICNSRQDILKSSIQIKIVNSDSFWSHSFQFAIWGAILTLVIMIFLKSSSSILNFIKIQSVAFFEIVKTYQGAFNNINYTNFLPYMLTKYYLFTCWSKQDVGGRL